MLTAAKLSRLNYRTVHRLWELLRQRAVAQAVRESRALGDDLRAWWRELAEGAPQPSAVILDGRTMQRTPKRGARAG